MRPNPQHLHSARLQNTLQTVLILAGLVALLGVPAWLLAGPIGVGMAVIVAVIAYQTAGRVPAQWVLQQQGAVPLTPWEAPELYRVVAELYRRAGLPDQPRLHHLPSPMLNAFAVGGREGGGIAVSDGLLRTLGLREIAGVLAHEVSHLRRNDMPVMSMAATMTNLTVWGAGLVQILVLLLFPTLIETHGAAVWWILLAVAVAPTASTLLQLALSRNREYAADMEAARLLGDAHGLARALAVLEYHQGSWLESYFGQRPGGILKWLQTHPPTQERIRRLRRLQDPEADGFEWPARLI